MEQIHAHEVIHMMLHSGKAYSRASLLEDIVALFGSDARFFACSAQNMTAQETIDFLEAKGKFVPVENGFQTAANLMCQH